MFLSFDFLIGYVNLESEFKEWEEVVGVSGGGWIGGRRVRVGSYLDSVGFGLGRKFE